MYLHNTYMYTQKGKIGQKKRKAEQILRKRYNLRCLTIMFAQQTLISDMTPHEVAF